MKKLNLKERAAKLKPFLRKVRTYMPIIFLVTVAILYGSLVFRVRSLASREPADDAVEEQLKTVQRPRIDQNALLKIQELQDNSAEVQALFKQARDNPFQE